MKRMLSFRRSKFKVIIFNPPKGSQIENPSLEFLQFLVFKEGEKFWASGSGDAGIYYSDETSNSQLTIMMKETEGFFVNFRNEIDEFVLLDYSKSNEMIIVYQGGEPWKLPSKYFVRKEIAWEAVQTFCREGKRNSALEWVEFDPPELI